MAMTKSEIDEKRKKIIEHCKSQFNEMSAILVDMRDLPGVEQNVNANLLISDILIRKKDTKKDIQIFTIESDSYIECFDEDSYFKYVQDVINSFKTRLNYFKFNASLKRPYGKAKFPRKVKKADLQYAFAEKESSTNPDEQSKEQNEIQLGE